MTTIDDQWCGTSGHYFYARPWARLTYKNIFLEWLSQGGEENATSLGCYTTIPIYGLPPIWCYLHQNKPIWFTPNQIGFGLVFTKPNQIPASRNHVENWFG